MPHADSDGAAIWWDSTGEGPAVLLLNGLSSTSEAWYRLVPHLAADHRVITMDNRGVGRSDVPRGRYRVTTMAEDALRVLDAAGEQSAHVVGISMGSVIAQELVLDHPDRVLSVVLAASNPGVRHSTYPSRRAMALISTGWARDHHSFHRKLIPFTYHPSTDPARVEEDLTQTRGAAPSRRGFFGQTFGVVGWDRYDDLPRIERPTLVLHGAEDLLDPVANARVLAERIPGAELVVLEDASHQLFTDQELAAAKAVRAHLAKAETLPA